MEMLMVVGGVWLMMAFCAILFIRGASAQTSLRRVPVMAHRTPRRPAMRRDAFRDALKDY